MNWKRLSLFDSGGTRGEMVGWENRELKLVGVNELELVKGITDIETPEN